MQQNSRVDFVLRPKTSKRKTILEAKLSAQGINPEGGSEFEKQFYQIQLGIESNRYRREPDSEGNWPCSMCYAYKPLSEYHNNATKPNLHENQCKVCRLEWRRNYLQRRKTGGRVGPKLTANKIGHQVCSKCKIEKHLNEYHSDKSKMSGKMSYCKPCSLQKRSQSSNSLEGCFQDMLDSSINHSKKSELGHVELTVRTISDLYLSQQGRCAISGVELTWTKHSKFKMTLERKDNTIGYVESNVHITCCQFNTIDQTKYSNPEFKTGSSQWTSEKWILAHRLYEPEYCQQRQDRLIFDLKPIPKRPYYTRHRHVKGDLWICSQCTEEKDISEYVKNTTRKLGHSSACKSCIWNGKNNMFSFLNYAFSSMQQRARVKKLECTLTRDDLNRMVLEQNGLCAISRIPMNFKSLSNWQCSVERKDNKLGYIPANTVLICLEFQTSDHSRPRTDQPRQAEFTSQWTPELYNEVFWPNGKQSDSKNWLPQLQTSTQ